MAVQLKRATTAQWAGEWASVIPADGEPVVEICVDGRRRWKLGDGAHVWDDLPYQGETSLDGLGDISPAIESLLGASDAAAARTVLSVSSSAATTGEIDAAVAAAALVSANIQTASYTLALSDAGKAVEINNASANTLTVPPNSAVAFPVGTLVEVFQVGVGQTSFAPGSGVTIRSAGSKVKLSGQYSAAVLRKRGTDDWSLVGDLSS